MSVILKFGILFFEVFKKLQETSQAAIIVHAQATDTLKRVYGLLPKYTEGFSASEKIAFYGENEALIEEIAKMVDTKQDNSIDFED